MIIILLNFFGSLSECVGRGGGGGWAGNTINLSCLLSPIDMYMTYHTQIPLMTPPPLQVMAVMFEVQKWVWPHQLASAVGLRILFLGIIGS